MLWCHLTQDRLWLQYFRFCVGYWWQPLQKWVSRKVPWKFNKHILSNVELTIITFFFTLDTNSYITIFLQKLLVKIRTFDLKTTYVKFQLEFSKSKVGGIRPLKLLFQANLFHIVKSVMSKMILPLNFVGLLYPSYQVIQIVSYDMNVWIVVLHNCKNENKKMKNINIWKVVPK